MTTSDVIIATAGLRDCAPVRSLLLKSMENDQGYGYHPEWHWDIDHLQEVYLDNPRCTLVVATINDHIVGACGLRVGGPSSPPHHPDLAAHYQDRSRTGQLVRLVVAPVARRMGVAGKLVAATLDFARAEGGYDVIYLHTNAKAGGAAAFWSQSGATLIRDDAGWETDPQFHTLHFEYRINTDH